MAAEYIRLMSHPVVVEMGHNGIPIDQVDDGFGELRDVFSIESLKYTNLTGTPYRLWFRDEFSNEWETNITPNDDGERNIPPPQRFRSFPLTSGVTRIKG